MLQAGLEEHCYIDTGPMFQATEKENMLNLLLSALAIRVAFVFNFNGANGMKWLYFYDIYIWI